MELAIADIDVGPRCRKSLGDLEALADSIRDLGLLQAPVVTPDGRLVAGFRRLRACQSLGWTVVPVQVAANLGDAARMLRAERDENVCREDFTPSEAVALGLQLEEIERAEAKKRQASAGPMEGQGKKSGPGNLPGAVGRTRDKVGAALGMSGKSYEKAKTVAAAAERFPEVAASMDRTGNIDAAYKELRRKEEEAAEETAVAEIAAAPPDWIQRDVVVASMRDFLAGRSGIDAILTDPPYPEEFLPLYGQLAEAAAKCLAPHGVLAVMVGQTYLPRVLADMAAHLPYRWTLAYLTPGGQAVQIWPRKINTFWKPILLFGAAPDWLGDVARSDVNDNDKRFHEWGQSESGMMDLVQRLTRPGQLVCDPFLGAGTTGVAALAAGRRFIGCDLAAVNVDKARARLWKAVQSCRE